MSAHIDWPTLSTTPVTRPLSVLSVLSQAGVDQYTLELLALFGRDFALPDHYIDLIEPRLTNTTQYGLRSTDAGILFFGTGASVIPRLLAQSRGGVALAALVMALRAVFDGRYTARVVACMLRASLPKEMVVPSAGQLEQVSNELAACRLDEEIGPAVWALEKMVEDGGPLIVEEMAVLLTILVGRQQDGRTIVARSMGPNVNWVAVFAYRVAGLKVIIETRDGDDRKVLWEQTPQAPRGTVKFVLVAEERILLPNPCPLWKAADEDLEYRVRRREEGVVDSVRVPIVDAVDGLLVWCAAKGIKSLALQCVAEAVCRIHGARIVWSEEPRFKAARPKAPRMAFRTCHVIAACRAMAPDVEISLPLNIADTPRLEKDDLDLLDLQFWEQIESFGKLPSGTRVQDIAPIFYILLCLLFIQADALLDFDHRGLQYLQHYPTSFLTSAFPSRYGDQLCYPGHLHGILRLLVSLPLAGNPEASESVAACASGGVYAVIGTVLDADQPIFDTLRVVFGKGGIFANGRAVPALHSASPPGRNLEDCVIMGLLELRAKRCCTLEHTNLLLSGKCGDLTQLPLRVDLRVSDLPGDVTIAWRVTARLAADLVVDIAISPHEIAKAELAVSHFHVEEEYGEDNTALSTTTETVTIRNVEAYLVGCAGMTEREKSVVACHGNKAARLLTTYTSCRTWRIKQTPGVPVKWCLDLVKNGGCVIMM